MFTVAKDCDGVLADSAIPVCFGTNKMIKDAGYNFQIKPSDLINYDFIYGEVLAKTGDKKLAQRANDQWFTSSVLREAPPCPGAVWAAFATKILGGDQHTITSRQPVNKNSPEAWQEMKESTLDWLREYISCMASVGQVHIREKDDRSSGDEFKLAQLSGLGAKAHFEDNVGTVSYLLKPENKEKIPHTRIYLVTTPMNKNFDVANLPGCRRVNPGLGILVATMAAAVLF